MDRSDFNRKPREKTVTIIRPYYFLNTFLNLYLSNNQRYSFSKNLFIKKIVLP